MMKTILLLCIVPCVVANGCSKHLDSQSLLVLAKKHVPKVARFITMYPHAITTISYLSNPNYQPILHVKIGRYGRYVLILEQQIQLNSDRTQVVHWGDATIDLLEVKSIDVTSGRASINYGPLQYELTEEQWDQLVSHHGELKVIDSRIITTSPIPLFTKYLNDM